MEFAEPRLAAGAADAVRARLGAAATTESVPMSHLVSWYCRRATTEAPPKGSRAGKCGRGAAAARPPCAEAASTALKEQRQAAQAKAASAAAAVAASASRNMAANTDQKFRANPPM